MGTASARIPAIGRLPLFVGFVVVVAILGCFFAFNSRNAIYVANHVVTFSEGAIQSDLTIELDKHGNALRETLVLDGTTSVTETAFDKNGTPTSQTAPDARGTMLTTTFESTLNGHGRLASLIATHEDGSTSAVTYAYDENDNPVAVTTVLHDGSDVVEDAYNEYGWRTTSLHNGTIRTDYQFETDDTGRVIELTQMPGSDTYTFQYDDNGNIGLVFCNGSLLYFYEYQRVRNPSDYARLQAELKAF